MAGPRARDWGMSADGGGRADAELVQTAPELGRVHRSSLLGVIEHDPTPRREHGGGRAVPPAALLNRTYDVTHRPVRLQPTAQQVGASRCRPDEKRPGSARVSPSAARSLTCRGVRAAATSSTSIRGCARARHRDRGGGCSGPGGLAALVRVVVGETPSRPPLPRHCRPLQHAAPSLGGALVQGGAPGRRRPHRSRHHPACAVGSSLSLLVARPAGGPAARVEDRSAEGPGPRGRAPRRASAGPHRSGRWWCPVSARALGKGATTLRSGTRPGSDAAASTPSRGRPSRWPGRRSVGRTGGSAGLSCAASRSSSASGTAGTP